MAKKWYDENYYQDDGTYKMIQNLLSKNKCKTILDVGCGTGRYVIKLSEIGLDISGIDISIDMIKKAKMKAPQLYFKCMDMKNIKLHRKFDAVVSLDSAFCYMLTNKDCIKAIESMKNVLNKNGLIILQTMNVWTDTVKEEIQGKWKEKNKRNGEIFQIEGFNELDLVEKILKQKNVYKKKTKNGYKIIAKDKEPVKLRFFTPNEIDLLFRISGIKTIGFYGDKNLNPFSEKNNYWLISVGRKI